MYHPETERCILIVGFDFTNVFQVYFFMTPTPQATIEVFFNILNNTKVIKHFLADWIINYGCLGVCAHFEDMGPKDPAPHR